MGAIEFNQTVIGKFKTGSEAIREARIEANAYNGHQDGYSGDIQTCDSVEFIGDAPRYRTKAFYRWEEKKLEDMAKGEAIMVEVKGLELKRLKGRRWHGKKGVRAFYIFGWGRY